MKSLAISFPILLALLAIGVSPISGQDNKKPVAGKADVLRHVPKKFAEFFGTDAKTGHVRLKIDGEKEISLWEVQPDAEMKVKGWWGRLDQFGKSDRVWVWFTMDRKKNPKRILMLADELSEQLIHGNSSTDFMTELSGQRKIQKDYLRKIWKTQGLPGTVTFLHPLGGEMEVMLDHEAMRWGRYLKTGDKITLTGKVRAVVKQVQPWRERTRLVLVTGSGLDQNDYSIGQRIHALVPEPPMKVQQAYEPTDIGRLKSKKERVDWFICNTYCTCKVPGDRCTGMFYSLASCNVNACGMPNKIRGMVGKMIDKGMNDREILRQLEKERGPALLIPHLLK